MPTIRRLTRAQYVDGILNGDRGVLGRAITLVESSRPDDAALAQEIIEACLPYTGGSIRAGITGLPGAGKSSLIESLGLMLTRDRGEKVAVLAVDPTSQISGGSILGDKTRMESLANQELAYILPSPSGGTLGGVARRTREAILICEAAGFRNVIVETVGVGQSETAVRSMVDFFLLVTIAGAGDELQGIKRGIIEMADLVAVNKADGGNREKAELARAELANALRLLAAPATGWKPQAVTCSALTGDGVQQLWAAVLEHHALLSANGSLGKLRQEQAKRWMHETIAAGLRARFESDSRVQAALPELEQEVAGGKLSPFAAAQKLLSLYD
jgi:LAO/AO transport system kinase